MSFNVSSITGYRFVFFLDNMNRCLADWLFLITEDSPFVFKANLSMS